MKILINTIAILIIKLCISTSTLHAQCPGYSWIVELHSKRRAINCKAASIEISQVLISISSALQSGREVYLNDFGTFLLQASKSSIRVKAAELKTKRIIFKANPILLNIINK